MRLPRVSKKQLLKIVVFVVVNEIRGTICVKLALHYHHLISPGAIMALSVAVAVLGAFLVWRDAGRKLWARLQASRASAAARRRSTFAGAARMRSTRASPSFTVRMSQG